MQLRNRRTGQTLFSTQTTQSTIVDERKDLPQDMVDDYFKDLKSGLSQTSYTFDEKAMIIAEIEKFQRNFKEEMLDAVTSNSPEKITKKLQEQMEQDAKLEEKFARESAQRKKEHVESKKLQETSFLSSVPQLMRTAKLSAGVGLLLLLPAEAASSVAVFEGQPTGGIDLCSSYILGCIQGYVVNGTESSAPLLSQFNRVMFAANSDPDTGAREQLRKCLNFDKMSELVASLFNADKTVSKLAPCSVDSSVWHGNRVGSTLSKVSSDVCEQYQNTFFSASQSCMSATGMAKEYLKIGLGVAGGVVGLAMVGCCVLYARRKYAERQERYQGLDLAARNA